jgi:hypothetical protein
MSSTLSLSLSYSASRIEVSVTPVQLPLAPLCRCLASIKISCSKVVATACDAYRSQLCAGGSRNISGTNHPLVELEWDACAPGLLCCVAFRTKLSPFGDDFPPKSLTHSNDAELELEPGRVSLAVK